MSRIDGKSTASRDMHIPAEGTDSGKKSLLTIGTTGEQVTVIYGKSSSGTAKGKLQNLLQSMSKPFRALIKTMVADRTSKTDGKGTTTSNINEKPGISGEIKFGNSQTVKFKVLDGEGGHRG